MNIGWQLQDDECGWDENLWVATHERVFGEDIERFVSDITAHTRASEIAAGIVRDSRRP